MKTFATKHLLLAALCLVDGALASCVWYGQCHNGGGSKMKNCKDFGEARAFAESEDEAMKILRAECPFLLEKYPGEKFCCDINMLKSMRSGMSMARASFGRCPTCLHNLFRHICEFTCSPDQSRFLLPKRVLVDGASGREYIDEVDIFVSDRYKEVTFNSCKDVVMPSTGEYVMTLACEYDRYCTPKKWFASMGNNANSYVPFQMNYISPPDDSHRPLDLDVRPCNESYDEGGPACSCADCEASCNIPFRDPAGGDHCPLVPDAFVYLVAGLCLVLLISVVFSFVSWRRRSGKSRDADFFGRGIRSALEDVFAAAGSRAAGNATLVLVVSSLIVAALSYGISLLVVTTEPGEIWAAPDCRSRAEKDYFESRFSPFYRTSQVFITTRKSGEANAGTTQSDGVIFRGELLRKVFDLQMSIQNINTEDGHGLKDICFAPMRNAYARDVTVEQCTVQSIFGYLQNDGSMLNDADRYVKRLESCLRNNYEADCLAPYGGPVFSPLVVVDFKNKETESDGVKFVEPDYASATGLVLTFLINNHADKARLGPALDWEKRFVDFMKRWTAEEKPDYVDVAFSAERSVQDEIERESNAELGTVLVSYFLMFLYITIALGKYRRISSLLADSRIMLGVGGIVIVIASVLSSLGLFGYLGVPTTLLTVEVIPFLVLAVGVDNIFILVHAVRNLERGKDETVEETIGRALGRIGPSILLTSLSEASCFFIGSLSSMPAVKTFALYSSVAIVINFCLQITAFVSWLSVDLRRIEAKRLDVLCCFESRKKKESDGDDDGGGGGPDVLPAFFRNHYGPFLMKPSVRVLVVTVFSLWLCASIWAATQIELGLDQELSMPEDSYLIDYFACLRDLFSMGPPVYFVVKKGINYSDDDHVNAICGSFGCDADSLVTYLTRAAKVEETSYIMKSPASWIDDFYDWISPEMQSFCCRKFDNGSYCPDGDEYDCVECDVELRSNSRPSDDDFNRYLPFFLTDVPSASCSKAGGASYSQAVHFEESEPGERRVADTHFMAYHSVLRTSKDYYTALERARNIAAYLSDTLSKKLDTVVEVFPYSVFYIFYEQYLTIVSDAVVSLSLSLATVFVVTFVLTGLDFASSLLVVVAVTSMMVDLLGLMYAWSITLNAISLVNLIVSVGIGVEFCSHSVYSFKTSATTDRISRALHSVGTIGSSIFSGITLTKFFGILVLAFAKSLIFRVFYFRMYLGMVVIGAAHGLVLLPVLLSYFGPRPTREFEGDDAVR